MDPQRANVLQNVINYISTLQVSLSELLLYALQQYNDPSHPILLDLALHTTSIASALYFQSATTARISAWALQLAHLRYSADVQALARPESGWHFNAAHTDPDQLRDFRIEDMVVSMHRKAPELWNLVRTLLGYRADELPPVETEILQPMEDEPDSDDEYWSHFDGEEETSEAKPDMRKTRKDLRAKQAKFANIKTAVIISILMQSHDPRCNALQSIMGIFCHASNAPEKVVKVLARMGVSISLKSVHRAIISLSKMSSRSIEDLGRTLLASYAFDNFDLLIKALIHTVDDPFARGLLHMTSGTLLRLDHGVTLDDLRCSRLLWERSERNIKGSDRRIFDPLQTMYHLYSLHPEPGVVEGGLTRRGSFRAWVFMRTLFEYGPSFFAQYTDKIAEPAPIDKIPVTKLYHVPLRAMDINQSTVSGNIDALLNMFAQAGVGDPMRHQSALGEPVEDLSEYVTLVHGDLGTYDRVNTALDRRAVEHTPHNRLQSVVFVMGLFHVKMAAADTIWRLLVTPAGARMDPLGFYRVAARLRPNESNHIISNAKFREQHELIGHVGSVLRLELWRTAVEKHTGFKSLNEWAASKPLLADVEEIAATIAQNHVEGDSVDMFDLTIQPQSARDEVLENSMRTHNYLLLYEELSYAMNAGDIGRVETVLAGWVPLFRAAGKHKYASRTLRFFHGLYFVYPERLRRAIRYNMLVNPSGKPNEFRAVDWVVEYLNLLIKVTYGGEGSNNTKTRLLLESVLVLIYQNTNKTIERNFALPGLTKSHSTANMRATFNTVLDGMLEDGSMGLSKYMRGRTSAYLVPDAIGNGMGIIEKEWAKKIRVTGDGQVQELDSVEMMEIEGEEDVVEAVPEDELTLDDLSTDGPL